MKDPKPSPVAFIILLFMAVFTFLATLFVREVMPRLGTLHTPMFGKDYYEYHLGAWLVLGAIILTIILVGCLVVYLKYNNGEVRLRNKFQAQLNNIEVTTDRVWKIIQQEAQLADKYENAFKEAYVAITAERYQRDNAAIRFIRENNPNLSTEIYNRVAASIESNREELARVQQKLIDTEMQHNNLRQTFPGSLFVGKRPELQLEILTSTKTDTMISRGREDDIDLFPKADRRSEGAKSN